MDSAPRDPDPQVAGAEARGEPDWIGAARFLRARLRRLLPGAQADDLDDMVQEALIDLIRTSRSEPIRNEDAILTTFAKRKAIDLLRRRQRWNELSLPETGEHDTRAVERWRATDPAERLAFTVVRFFARERSACEPLARAFLTGHDWASVAHSAGSSEVAVRKQWSRCVEHLRRTWQGDAAANPAAVWPWLGRDQERDDAGR
ncbi:MAG: sigma factor [Candidatus Eisenbacteria bacterium]